MKKILPFLILLVVASCKKEELGDYLTKDFSIQSASTGATYHINVALPDHYHASGKYAAIYVLDGEDNFDFVAGSCKKYSRDYSKSDVLVVSIGYGRNRALDYTPTDAAEGDGGAEQFLQFINNELIPEMESAFGADTSRDSRILLGHSFGGLCAAYAFTHHNEMFGHYMLLSPSLWYDNLVMLRYEQDKRAANQARPQHVFMGLGEMENSGRMLAPYMAFYQRLQSHYPDMQAMSHLVPHLDHMGSKNPNITEALKFYFQQQ
ncbi:MAG: alpha/beta hydrolase [Bacteroidia bacterium]|nr:alpha/beta hydrolase [Bacteroidia bacterium]